MSRRKQKLSETATACIESLNHDGRGVTHIDGKTVFVDYALPGETVRLRYLRTRSKWNEAETLEVQETSPQRIEPFCPHFYTCGGCSLQHLQPGAQIEYKQDVLLEQLRRIGGIVPQAVLDPLTGPVRGYRHKARLGVKYVFKKEKLLIGFREKRSSFVADIEECGVLHPAIGALLPALKTLIAGLSIFNAIPQIEVAVGDAQTALVIRHLRPLGDQDMERLRTFERERGVIFYLQPGGPETVVPLIPRITESGLFYRLEEEGLTLSFDPLDFTQVNFAMNRILVEHIRRLLQPQKSDSVLDLFCGLGNFTLPLAQQVAKVTGVEGETALVDKARQNAQDNEIANAEFHQANLQQTGLQASFLRQHYDKILLDPPRGGAREILQRLNTGKVKRIVYVSCSPATLARDAGILVNEKGFTLINAGVVDMFPHTSHVESVALFQL